MQNAYELHKKVRAARGVKLTAKDLERVIAGMPVLVAEQPDEIPVLKVRAPARRLSRFGFSLERPLTRPICLPALCSLARPFE